MPRTLFDKVRASSVLHGAWRQVRENGLASPQVRTRDSVKQFDAEAHKRLQRIARQLRTDRFEFALQEGVLITRGAGKPRRPIVMAAIENRIVQRAHLNVLQDVPTIRALLLSQTSFGGLPSRGVRTAIAEAARAIEGGQAWYYRSDIKDFFTRIPRAAVIDRVRTAVADERVCALLAKAAETRLRPENLVKLGEDSRMFPLDDTGVAQGSALSAFMGNIFLHDFDEVMNGRGIRFIRYIDDFLILGPTARHVQKAFNSARARLEAFGMVAYDKTSQSKAASGRTDLGFDFLGANIRNQRIEPSEKSRKAILERIARVISHSKQTIGRLAKGDDRPFDRRARFAQTVAHVDLILEGWGDAFDYCDPRSAWGAIDRRVDLLLDDLRLAFSRRWRRAASPAIRRQMMGVRSLAEIGGTSWKQLIEDDALV